MKNEARLTVTQLKPHRASVKIREGKSSRIARRSGPAVRGAIRRKRARRRRRKKKVNIISNEQTNTAAAYAYLNRSMHEVIEMSALMMTH